MSKVSIYEIPIFSLSHKQIKQNKNGVEYTLF